MKSTFLLFSSIICLWVLVAFPDNVNAGDDDIAKHLCCTTGSFPRKSGNRLLSIQKFLKRVKEKTGSQACGAFGWQQCSLYVERDLYALEYRSEPTYEVVQRSCSPDVTVCCKGFYKIEHPYLKNQCFDVNDKKLADLLKKTLGLID